MFVAVMQGRTGPKIIVFSTEKKGDWFQQANVKLGNNQNEMSFLSFQTMNSTVFLYLVLQVLSLRRHVNYCYDKVHKYSQDLIVINSFNLSKAQLSGSV